MDVPTEFPASHKQKRKRFADESERSEEGNHQETESNLFKNNVFYVALDNLISALDTCFGAMQIYVKSLLQYWNSGIYKKIRFTQFAIH